MRGQEARGEVLVHDGLDAPVDAGLLLDDGNAAAAARDDHEAREEERPDGLGLHDAHGARRGNEPPVASAGVLDHHPAVAGAVALGFISRVAAADRLGRVLEGGVREIDDGLGQHARDAVGHAPAPQLADERVADDVADAAYGVGDAHVEREPRGELRVARHLGAAEDEAHLGPVAVGQDDAPAVGHERADVGRRVARVHELLGDGPGLALVDQRIATHRYDGGFCGQRHAGTFSRRASSRRAPEKQARGAFAIPAPIWPMPASRCAIPVLITGWTPLSTTRRASMPVGVPAKPSAGIPKSLLRASVIVYMRFV